jgi:hypothetical protein
MDITAFLGVAPYSPVVMHGRFGENCVRIRRPFTIKKDRTCFSETSTHTYQIVRRHIPKDSNIHILWCASWKSHFVIFKLRKAAKTGNSKIFHDKCNLLLTYIDGINHQISHLLIIMPYTAYFICAYFCRSGAAVAQLVAALRYKPEGRGFGSRWCHWNFSLT